MRTIRTPFLLGAAALSCLSSTPASAVDGVIEINQTSITAAGGFPHTISASGSYVITGNLLSPPGTTALALGANNVEIDLNGFTIQSAGGGGIGIDAGLFSGLTVRKGVVQGFAGAGIAAASESKLIELKLTGNGVGVIGGINCLILNSNVVGNVSNGIEAMNCKIENNIIASNGGLGIIGGAGDLIVHNRIAGNGGGIFDGGGAKIQENVISGNVSFGISDTAVPPPVVPPLPGPPRTNIIGNVIDGTLGGPGISTQLPALITDNSVSNSFAGGIVCGASCTVRGNMVDRNNLGAVPGAGGVSVAAGSNVHANSISFNMGFGLILPPTAGYTNNTITGNGTPLGFGPDVITPPSVTGAFGNNCSGAPCP